uniref:Uncharacterized protein n=1 Tax=Rhizophora mucronata TaxID=61149 RepID=A0A2P2QPI9_RHIMU
MNKQFSPLIAMAIICIIELWLDAASSLKKDFVGEAEVLKLQLSPKNSS